MIIDFKKNQSIFKKKINYKFLLKEKLIFLINYVYLSFINFFYYIFIILRNFFREKYPSFFIKLKSIRVLNFIKNFLYSSIFTNYSFSEKSLQIVFKNFFYSKFYNLKEKIDLLIQFEKNCFKNKNIDISIIVPVYGNLNHTIDCLLSILLSDQKNLSLEIIVINDKPDDKSYDFLLNFKNIKYLVNNKNLGFIKTCNKAALISKGKYLYFLNNDTFLTDFTISNLYETFRNEINAGLVGSQMLYPSLYFLQEAGSLIFRDGSAYNFGKHDLIFKDHYNFMREVDYCSGCSLMINKKIFMQVEMFDCLYQPAYYEDVDLAFKIRKKNLRCLYQPSSKIIHFEGASSGTDINKGVKRYQLINQSHFFKKWKKNLKNHVLYSNLYKNFKYQFEYYFKKKVLFIDEINCRPTMDAGSYYMFNFMRSLVNNLCNVVLLTPFTTYQEKVELGKYGIKCPQNGIDFKTLKNYLSENLFHFDLIILTRPVIFNSYYKLIKSLGFKGKIIYNTIDLHFLRYEREYNLNKNKNTLQLSRKFKKIEINAIKKSDKTLIFGKSDLNYLIQNKIIKKNKLLSFPVIQDINFINNLNNKKDKIIFIANFNHQPNVDALNNFINNIFYLNNTNLQLVIIGKDANKKIILENSKKKNIIFLGYVEDLSKCFKDALFSIAPIRYGAGLNGKVLLSMSHGVPVIATKYVMKSLNLKDMQNAILCENKADFENKIKYTKSNQNFYKKLSKNSIKFIADNFSLKVNKKNVKQILN